MSRKALIAANWKMYKTPAEAKAFVDAFLPLVAGHTRDEIALFPSPVLLPTVDCCMQGLERGRGRAEHPLCRGGRLHRRDLGAAVDGRGRNAYAHRPLRAPAVLCRDRRDREQEAAHGAQAWHRADGLHRRSACRARGRQNGERVEDAGDRRVRGHHARGRRSRS